MMLVSITCTCGLDSFYKMLRKVEKMNLATRKKGVNCSDVSGCFPQQKDNICRYWFGFKFTKIKHITCLCVCVCVSWRQLLSLCVLSDHNCFQPARACLASWVFVVVFSCSHSHLSLSLPTRSTLF